MTPIAVASEPAANSAAPSGQSEPAQRRRAVFHPLRVAAVDRLTTDSVAITFDVPDELREEFRFDAGQHLSVRAPAVGDDVRRNYSICAPATGGPLRIGVKRLPDGAFSRYAAEQLRPGDVLDVMTPTGTFTTRVDAAQAKRYVAVAAGSGITPVLSILATVLEVETLSTAALVYVNRRASTIMFLEELADLKDRYPERCELLHVLGQESTEAVDLLSGRLDAGRMGRILDTVLPVDDVDEWFLCGPLAMTDAVRGVLLERGVDASHVHRELFHVGTPVGRRPPLQPRDHPLQGSEVGTQAGSGIGTQAGSGIGTQVGSGIGTQIGSDVTVVLDGRSVTFTLPPDGDAILDEVLLARPDVPYSCRNAVCGTCRARVVEGQVRMDSNYALEPDEVARGYVLTCQSHPVTARVVVDFDQ